VGRKRGEAALAAEPQSDGPAAKAGIQAGDVITAVNDQPVKDARDLARKIGGLPPKTTVKLTVINKGTEKTVSLTLGELPREQRQAKADTEDKDSTGASLPPLGPSPAPSPPPARPRPQPPLPPP